VLFYATFNNISGYIIAISFIGGGNQSILRKALLLVTDKLYHIMLYRVLSKCNKG